MNKLKNKRVFVTGGANGIGRAIVKAFCLSEARVAFCDIDLKGAEILLSELGNDNCFFIAANAADKKELEDAAGKVISEWGDIDILVNNVGVGIFKNITDTSVDEFDEIIHINLRSSFITSRLLAIHRKAQKAENRYGRIINISSTRYLMSEPDSEAYAASKGGIFSLTHALAMSLSGYGITVNSISPGWIEVGDYSVLKESDHSQHPSGRVGVPDDIARMCIFLSQPENDFINAQNIIIDGGMTKKMIYEE